MIARSFSSSSSEERRKRQQEQLEAQLEVVIEQEGAVCAPDIHRVGKRSQDDGAYQRDLEQAQELRIRHQVQRSKSVSVRYAAHEPSPHVIRLRGRVGKPIVEHRDAFHRHMHAWKTPMAESAGLDALLAKTADLWVESLHESFFYDQFTPAKEEEARREARPGVWSHLRRPFIAWRPSRPASSIKAPTPVSADDVMICVPLSSLSQEGVQEQEAIATMPQSAETLPTSKGSRSWFARRSDARRAQQEEAVYQERLRQERLADTGQEQLVEGSAWSVPQVEPHVRHERFLLTFIALACFIALPAGAVAWSRGVVRQAQDVQRVAMTVAERPFSLNSLEDWQRRFTDVQRVVGSLQGSSAVPLAIARYIPGVHQEARAADALFTMAREGGEAARLLAMGGQRVMAADAGSPEDRLNRLQQYIDEAAPFIERVYQAAQRLPLEGVPSAYREQVQRLQTELFAVEPLVRDAPTLFRTLRAMLGSERPRAYLLVFQNQAELRPSGGFMGSYAEVTVDRGAIKRITIPGGGPYDLRSQLKKRWIPPEPLQLVGQRWEFQDANWSPDFAETAGILQRFWSAAGQPTIDGIVAVNATILPTLVGLTGPIEMPQYGKVLTAENVVFETQKAVELEYDKEQNTPKAFIGDLYQEVVARLQTLPPERLPDVLAVMGRALQTKEAQLWLARPEEQSLARSFGWTGEWSQDDLGSFLGVIGANIAGQKSDAAIREKVIHQVTIQETGRVQESVALERAHTAVTNALFYGANNVQYLRVFTPMGSRLLTAEGVEPPAEALFERPTEHEELFPGQASTTKRMLAGGAWLDEGTELGRTVFGGWIQLRPQTEGVFRLVYELAKTTADTRQALGTSATLTQVTDAYRLQVMRQSGADRAYRATIQYPVGWEVLSSSPGIERIRPGTLTFTRESLEQDEEIVVLFDRYANLSN